MIDRITLVFLHGELCVQFFVCMIWTNPLFSNKQY